MTQERPAEAELPALLREVTGAWRETAGRALHGPGCGCCGAQPIILDPMTLAEDIEYALRKRLQAAGGSGELSLLDAHPPADGADFIGRLRAIGGEGDTASVRSILRAVLQMLRTIGGGSHASD